MMYGSTPRTPIKRRVLTPHTPGKVRKVNCPRQAEGLAGTLLALRCWHDTVCVVVRAPPLGSVSQRCQKGSGVLQQGKGCRNGAGLWPLLSVGAVGLVGVPRSWKALCGWCFHSAFPGVAQPRLPPPSPGALLSPSSTALPSPAPPPTALFARPSGQLSTTHRPLGCRPPEGR